MEIQTLKLRNNSFLMFVFCCIAFTSCSEKDKYKNTAEQAIEERRIIAEQNFENEQFINRIWQELNRLSDDMTELQVYREVYSVTNKKSKMASIEKSLKNIENQLLKAEESGVIKSKDKQIIDDLRNAIKHKDQTIRKLKSQIENLQAENSSLFNELQKKNIELQKKNQTLTNQLNEQMRMQNEITNSIVSRYENMGDALRLSVIRIGEYNGTGNLKQVKLAQLKILEECLSCYKEALKHSYGSHRYTIEDKIRRTQIGINEYRYSKNLDYLRF